MAGSCTSACMRRYSPSSTRRSPCPILKWSTRPPGVPKCKPRPPKPAPSRRTPISSATRSRCNTAAVSVSPRIRNFQRSNVVPKKRSTEFASCFVLEGDSSRVLEEEQTQGVGDRTFPGGRRRCKLAGVLAWRDLRMARILRMCPSRCREDDRARDDGCCQHSGSHRLRTAP